VKELLRFRNKKEAGQAKEGDRMATEGKMNSIFGKGCKITGTVEVREGTVRIDGEFEGTIDCPDTMVVGKDGRVKADVKVKHAIIGGTVLGNIDAEDKIELQAGSRLEGDIKTKRLVIDEGVFFEGSCSMSPDGKQSKPKIKLPEEGQKKEEGKEEKKPADSWMK
jgi:cytoskeletal protein CcmA (bactofilin family)